MHATLAAGEEGQAEQNRRDSLSVPEMPTMDIAEFEALESEALQYANKRKSKHSQAHTPTDQQGSHAAATAPAPALEKRGTMLPACSMWTVPRCDIADASMGCAGTSSRDSLPHLEVCTSPSLAEPAVCASPRVPGSGVMSGPRSTGGSKQGSQRCTATVAAGTSAEETMPSADAAARAIKNALVNQSLTGVGLPVCCIPNPLASNASLTLHPSHRKALIGGINLQGCFVFPSCTRLLSSSLQCDMCAKSQQEHSARMLAHCT
jgi:hypothetical protein